MEPISITAAAVAAVVTRQVARKKLAAKKMAWLESFMPAAYKVCAEYGVPPQVCVAQAALESGWGIAAGGYNYFGLKGKGTAGSSSWASNEFIDGQKVLKTSSFAKFLNMEDGIRGYCQAVTGNAWFKPAAQLYPNDPAKFVTWLWGSGYASGPNYSNTLVGVMRTIYRATGDEAYNVHVDAELQKIIKKLQAKKMGRPRRTATAELLNPDGLTTEIAALTNPEGETFSDMAGTDMAGSHAIPSYDVPGQGFAGAHAIPSYNVPGQGFAGSHYQRSYNIPGTGVPMSGSHAVPSYDVPGQGFAGAHAVPSYDVPGQGFAGGHFEPLYSIPGGQPPMAGLAGEGAKALEDETSPLWWIIPAVALGVGIEWWLRQAKAKKA